MECYRCVSGAEEGPFPLLLQDAVDPATHTEVMSPISSAFKCLRLALRIHYLLLRAKTFKHNGFVL